MKSSGSAPPEDEAKSPEPLAVPINGLAKSAMSVLSDSDNKAISEMQIKIDGLEKKMSMMDALVPEETKVRNLNENDLFLLKLANKKAR